VSGRLNWLNRRPGEFQINTEKHQHHSQLKNYPVFDFLQFLTFKTTAISIQSQSIVNALSYISIFTFFNNINAIKYSSRRAQLSALMRHALLKSG
jgi:hypothetical protein